MGKSKQIGREKKNLIVETNNLQVSQEKREMIKARIAELTDEQIEKLFENGKISQSEYEVILDYRKKIKKKKSEKEKFEERIRCNNGIIQKIINIGRKFRRQEMQKQAGYNELDKNQELEREERMRTRGDGQKQMERGRSSGGRTHDR